MRRNLVRGNLGPVWCIYARIKHYLGLDYRQTDRQKDRQTNRQTDRKTNKTNHRSKKRQKGERNVMIEKRQTNGQCSIKKYF